MRQNLDVKYKTCATCKVPFPATPECFYQDGLDYMCKECRKKAGVKYRVRKRKRKLEGVPKHKKTEQSVKSYRKARETKRRCRGLSGLKRCTHKLPEGYYSRCPYCVAAENPVMD